MRSAAPRRLRERKHGGLGRGAVIERGSDVRARHRAGPREHFGAPNGPLGSSNRRRASPITRRPVSRSGRSFVMMTRIRMLCARAGASAITAALALSPIHATVPKPIVDLSKSPAISGKAATPPPKQVAKKPMIGPFDEQTAELGGGAIALLVLGAGAVALSRRKKHDAAEWKQEGGNVAEPRDPLFDEPMFQDDRTPEPSAFKWANLRHSGERKIDNPNRGETWVERAYRGPTPDNPSLSLRTRLKRAAFFDKRQREAAAGKAAPVDTDAGLPAAMTDEREREAA